MTKVLKRFVKYSKKSMSLILAFTIIVSVCAVSGLSFNLAAATDISGKTLYFNVSQNADWSAKTNFTAEFVDADGNIISSGEFAKSGSEYYVTVPNGVSSAVKITIKARNFTAPSGLPAIPSGKYRIISADTQRKTLYSWSSTSNTYASAWPGTDMTAAGSYYYADVSKSYDYCILSNAGQSKTKDLEVKTYDDIAYFDGSNFQTTLNASINISDIPSGGNEIFAVTQGSNTVLKASKYTYPDLNNIEKQTVCVYNPSWVNLTSPVLTYDLSDPMNTTCAMTKKTNANGIVYFQAEVPKGATFTIQPNASDNTGITETLSYPTGTYTSGNPATYIMTGTKYWGTLADLPSESETRIPNNFSSEIHPVKATYYDYLTDGELTNGYLSPSNNGDWYPFNVLNKAISSAADSNSNWKVPLYFGNFNANTTGYYDNFTPSRFIYPANNSYGFTSGSTHYGLYDYHQSVQGLVQNTLSNNNLMATSSLKMPCFDRDFLTNPSKNSQNKTLAKVFDSYFPFVSSTNSSGVTTYSFDSSGNGQKSNSDNVYFTWNQTSPTAVNYGKGSNYAVTDGSTDFGLTDGTGYGIFPFNNTSATYGSRGGNGKLDFGFGIKLEMDFRVPQNGTLDGTAGGSPVMFNYSGDDDLWLYISEEDGSNSQLALDLGGDHKFTSGSINFNTMQAKADNVYSTFEDTGAATIPSDQFYIKSSASSYYLYMWKSGNSNSQIELTQKDSTGNYFVVTKDMIGDFTNCLFKPNKDDWNNKSGDLTISNLYGKAFDTTGAEYNTSSASNNGTIINSSKTKTLNNGEKLDPTKTYKMTIFYMERGLIESNFKINFTTTPITNDLQVDKTVNTASVNNDTLASEIKSNQNFNYSVDDSTGNTSGKQYVFTDSRSNKSIKTVSNSKIDLKDSENADFQNSFATKSQMTFNENKSSTGVQYSTKWGLYDQKTGVQIKNADDSTNASFKLVDPTSESSDAKLKLRYTNTVETTNLLLNKEVVDSSGTKLATQPKEDFTFKVLLDLNGSTAYKNYPLYYTKTSNGVEKTYYTDADSNYEISFTPDETVKVTGLPVGASYKVEENAITGYALANSNGLTGILTKNVTATVNVQNKQSTGSGSLTVNKTLDDKNYTGSKFSFTLTGLPSMDTSHKDSSDNTIKSIDVQGKATKASQSTDGTVTFSAGNALTFAKVGYYRYKITEDSLSDTDYKTDSTSYFAEIYVNEDNSKNLYIDTAKTVFYKATVAQAQSSDYAAIFAGTKLSSVTFANSTTHGTVTINKSGQNGNSISNTVFALVKVSGEDILTDEDIKNIIATQQSHIIKATTDNNGKAVFDNVLIFKDGDGEFSTSNGSVSWKVANGVDYITSGTATKQTYCLFEYSPASGYNPSGVRQYFTLPKDNKYDVTFGYVDGAITIPDASGGGMNMFVVAGLAVAGAAAALFAAYIVYDRIVRKKRRRRYSAKTE